MTHHGTIENMEQWTLINNNATGEEPRKNMKKHPVHHFIGLARMQCWALIKSISNGHSKVDGTGART